MSARHSPAFLRAIFALALLLFPAFRSEALFFPDFRKSPREVFRDGVALFSGKKKAAGTWRVADYRVSLVEKYESSFIAIEPSLFSAEGFDATELLESLDGRSGRGIPGGEDAGAKDAETVPEFVFGDASGNVRRFSFDGEQTEFRRDGGGIVIVSAYKSRIKRRAFDMTGRLVSVEIFGIGQNARSMERFSETRLSYDGGSVPSSSTETDFAGKKRSHVEFSPSGLPVRIEESVLDDFGAVFPLSVTERAYDGENRLVAENVERRFYEDAAKKTKDGERMTKKAAGSSSSRKEFDYGGAGKEPDCRMYEDGELRLERVYSGEESYSERTFFDGGFSVLARFSGGVKVSETVYFNDVEVRRRDF